MSEPAFAELVAATNYSFLRGASSPAEMVFQAAALGMKGIGIADRNTVAGVVRAWAAVKRAKSSNALPANFKLATGARLVFSDGTPDIVAYPKTRLGWGRLTRLLTVGNMRAAKGSCILRFDDLTAHLQDVLLIVLPGSTADEEAPHKKPPDYMYRDMGEGLRLVEQTPSGLENILARLSKLAPHCVWLGAAMHRQGTDDRKLSELQNLARRAGVPLIAVNDALYASAENRPLHDILTAIRLGMCVKDAGKNLQANAERYLKHTSETARLFTRAPQAIK